MTLNSSGQLSTGGTVIGESVNLELGQSATQLITLNDTNARALAGIPVGAIRLPIDFWGKTGQTKRSLRFRTSASAYLSRTPTVASGMNQWTFSVWFKLGNIISGSAFYILSGNTNTGGPTRNELTVNVQPSGQFSVWAFNNSSGYYFQRFSNNLLRDPAAWYHAVVQFDPDNVSSASKVNAWINGVAVTWATSTDSGVAGSITSSAYRSINNTYQNVIGAGYQGGSPPVYFADGYMTEINMVSGMLMPPTAFGQINSATGQWIPITYSGAYGTNGFYLNFLNNSGGASTLGLDVSGNANNWLLNNFSV